MDFSWIDILIILILLVFTVRGFIQGFVKTFLSLAIVIGGLIIAKIFSPKLALYVKTNLKIYDKIERFINEKVSLLFKANPSAEALTENNGLYNIPKGLQKFIDNLVDGAGKTVGNATDAFSKDAADIILSVLCFVAILLAAILIGKLLLLILNKLAELPVLRSFNKLGGLLMGLIVGILVVAIISTSLYYINVLLGAEALSTAINNSFLIKYFYFGFIFS